MKTRKRMSCVVVCILLCLSVTVAGCGPHARYPLSDGAVAEIYTAADENSTWMDCNRYATERADYYFETSLQSAQTDQFIETAEEVLQDYPQDKASVNTAYVGQIRNAVNTINRTIDIFYFNIGDLSHLDLLIELNAKKYGESTPYGLLYAYSYGQCIESGYEVPPDDE